MKEYRIIELCKGTFIVQQKKFWWWKTEQHLVPYWGRLRLKSYQFETMKQAADWVLNQQPRLATQRKIVQTMLLY